ncbi:MAG: hypothetical protein ABIJ15_00745 [bacterium]
MTVGEKNMKPNNLNSSLFNFDYVIVKKQWLRNFKEIIKDLKKLKTRSKTNIKKIAEKDLRKTIENHIKDNAEEFTRIIELIELQVRVLVKLEEFSVETLNKHLFLTLTLFRMFHKKDISKSLERKLSCICNRLKCRFTKFKKKF